MRATQGKTANIAPLYEMGNLALMSNAIESEIGRPGHDRALMIASTLQSTLDLEKLIEIFSKEVNELVPHSGMTFNHTQHQIEIQIGHPARNCFTYDLVVAEQSLGEISFSRQQKFTAHETMILEYLLCGLAYPLRNAIMYKHALTAALKDPLTGVNNRSAMNAALVRETELARRHGTPLSIIMLDIDFFKKVNDTYGHLAGDFVLRTVADTITLCTRSSDILFRSGGEEFLILLSNTDLAGACLLAERIRKNIEAHEYLYGEHRIPVTSSFGVSILRQGDDSEQLVDQADQALYAAKRDGRNCVHHMNPAD